MKKNLYSCGLTVLLLALALAACSSKAGTGSQAGTSGQELSQVEQLVIGTFKLEGTPNAVDAKEAADLLPLWQAYNQLGRSDTAAQAEIDALISQIQATMTAKQNQAIAAMKLTRQDMVTTMSSLGLGNFQPGAQGTPGFSGTPPARSSSGDGGGFPGGAGGPPAGRPPEGGFGPGGDFGGGGFQGAGSSGASATLSATQVATFRANSNRISPFLLNALIELLQKRSGS